jgi:radical SAM superfamily enzyme YgiQ (UPF0313 family)
MKIKPPAVLLINPWIYDFAAYDLWVKPLGLLYIAGVLRKNGYEIHFIDCLDAGDHQLMDTKGIKKADRKHYGTGHFLKEHIEKPVALNAIPRKYSRYGISPQLFQEELHSIPKPDVILVTSMMTYWYPGVVEVIRRVKNSYPDVPVILGGIYATLCHNHALNFSGADFCISGKGEVSTLAKVSELTQHKTTFMPNFADLDSLPYPAFDLLLNHDALSILTARGCPYKCTYCASSLLNDVFREREATSVIDEITHWIDDYHVKDFAFYDDALLCRSEKKLISLLKGIIKSTSNCSFHAPNGLHVRGMSEEIADLLFQAGFKTIRLGLESTDEVRQLQTGKKTTNKEFEEAIQYLRKAGYQPEDIGVYLLIGLPGQHIQEIRKSIQFVRDCGARPFLAEYSPIPGTQLWEEALKHSPFDLVNEPLFHNNSILPCRSDGLSWEELYTLKGELREETGGKKENV